MKLKSKLNCEIKKKSYFIELEIFFQFFMNYVMNVVKKSRAKIDLSRLILHLLMFSFTLLSSQQLILFSIPFQKNILRLKTIRTWRIFCVNYLFYVISISSWFRVKVWLYYKQNTNRTGSFILCMSAWVQDLLLLCDSAPFEKLFRFHFLGKFMIFRKYYYLFFSTIHFNKQKKKFY